MLLHRSNKAARLQIHLCRERDFGIWQYEKTLDDVEGDVTVDLSYQYGLRINGKQVYDAGQLKNVIIEKALRFGSKEGTSRSNATYKQARVVDAPFEAADAVNYNTYAMYYYKNQVSHFSNTTVGFKPSSLTTYDIILKNVTLNGQVLGNVTIKDVEAELMEGSGNNAKSYFYTTLKNGKAVLSNAGALAKELGLSDGAELTVDTVGGYVFNGNVSGTYKFLLGEDEVACYVATTDSRRRKSTTTSSCRSAAWTATTPTKHSSSPTSATAMLQSC